MLRYREVTLDCVRDALDSLGFDHEVEATTPLRALELDSLQTLELLIAIDDAVESRTAIDEVDFDSSDTVADLVRALNAGARRAGPAPAGAPAARG
jgi:acyl carrier protein